MITKIQAYFEKRAFGVCEWLGEKLGIRSSRVRMYFIYLSFLTFGSPLIIYLILAFFIEHKDRFKRKRKTVWDL